MMSLIQGATSSQNEWISRDDIRGWCYGLILCFMGLQLSNVVFGVRSLLYTSGKAKLTKLQSWKFIPSGGADPESVLVFAVIFGGCWFGDICHIVCMAISGLCVRFLLQAPKQRPSRHHVGPLARTGATFKQQTRVAAEGSHRGGTSLQSMKSCKSSRDESTSGFSPTMPHCEEMTKKTDVTGESSSGKFKRISIPHADSNVSSSNPDDKRRGNPPHKHRVEARHSNERLMVSSDFEAPCEGFLDVAAGEIVRVILPSENGSQWVYASVAAPGLERKPEYAALYPEEGWIPTSVLSEFACADGHRLKCL